MANNGKDVLIDSLSKDLFPFTGQIVNEMRATTIILFKRLARSLDIPFYQSNKVSTDSEVSSTYLLEDEYTGWLPEQLFKLLGTHYATEEIVQGVDNKPHKAYSIVDRKWKFLEDHIEFCYKYGGNGHGDNAHGLLYNTSIHASGVILYPYDDKNILPKTSQGVTYRGHDLEEVGFIKYDLLGLESLDPINAFMDKIRKDKGWSKDYFDWEDTTDEVIWKEVFQKADTDFVFQFSSPGMKKALTTVKPDNISTLAELNALYRPGCINAGIFSNYINNTFSEKDLIVGSFLKEEFGEDHSNAMIFQEDIMRIVQKMAGFSLTDADLVRRAMQRKEADRMASYKDQFIQGFNKEKYGDIAVDVWNAIEAFATYAFNKSHSVAYACIAYWTAYIFHYYKDEFFEYTLDKGIDKQKAIAYLSSNGYEIVFPTLQTKNETFKVKDNKVYIPTKSVVDQSLGEYLLSLNADKNTMITKYGILDDICMDRRGIRNLFKEIPAKNIANIAPTNMLEIAEKKTIVELLRSLQDIGLLEYEESGAGYVIKVNKARSQKECCLRVKSIDSDMRKYNCQEDYRQYGIVRPLYADKAPRDFNEERKAEIYNRLNSTVANKYKEGVTFRRDLEKILNEKCLNYKEVSLIESKPYNAVLTELKIAGWKKNATLAFSDNLLEYRLVNTFGDTTLIKSLDKNTPVSVRFKVVATVSSDYTVGLSIQIAEMKERKEDQL